MKGKKPKYCYKSHNKKAIFIDGLSVPFCGECFLFTFLRCKKNKWKLGKWRKI